MAKTRILIVLKRTVSFYNELIIWSLVMFSQKLSNFDSRFWRLHNLKWSHFWFNVWSRCQNHKDKKVLTTENLDVWSLTSHESQLFCEIDLVILHLCVISPQCRNFMIFLSLKFYVKSNLRISEVQNMSFYHILGLWILTFKHFCTFRRLEFTKN